MSKKAKQKPIPNTFAAGRKLAVALLAEVEEHDDRRRSKDTNGLPSWGRFDFDAYIPDTAEGDLPVRAGPQDNIVLRYLERIGDAAEARKGFTAVLTDALASVYCSLGTKALRVYKRPPYEGPVSESANRRRRTRVAPGMPA